MKMIVWQLQKLNMVIMIDWHPESHKSLMLTVYKQSALEICATLDANLSLSPYLISEVATLSFSFTIGTYPSLNRLSNVLFALIALLLCSVSSKVSNI